jgi:hypothetical protein
MILTPVVIGTIGVTLLLIAFGLNILGVLSGRGRVYLLMNIAGALLAAWYAWSGSQIPFLVLEGVWAAAALVRLIATLTKKAPGTSPGA